MTEDQDKNNSSNHDNPDSKEIVLSEEAPKLTTWQKFTTHMKDNADLYIIGAGCFIVGFVGAVVVMHKNIKINNVIAPTFHNDNSSHATAAAFAGRQRKLVENLETGHVFKSVTEAAAGAGVPVPLMSKHINGHAGYDAVSGQHYAIIGLGTK